MQRRAEPYERPGVLGEQLERLLEATCRAGVISSAELGEPGTVARVHRELRPVELTAPERPLPRELGVRFDNVVLGQPDEPEQPVKSAGGIPLAKIGLAILGDRAFPEDGLGAAERTTRDMD